jgi:outer membrane protein insertion porin family
MKRSKQNLMNTGYFEEANLATAKGSAGNKLNYNVDVKEKPTGSFSVGGGYSSLDGIIGQGSVQQTNFLGLGLKANLSASLGAKSQTYSIGITDPYFLDTKWNLGGDIYRSQRSYSDYTRRLTGADIKGGYPINDFVGTFFMYKFEVKDLYNPQQAYQIFNNADPDSFPLGETTTSSIMASVTHNNTDYRLDPSTGFIDTVSAEFAGLGGNNKFARFTMENTWFHPIYKKVVFSTKLALGYIQEVEGQLVPIDEKFYLGGIYSLIGYKARTVCPVNHLGLASPVNGSPSDQVVYLGGNKEVYGNAEFSFPLLAEAGVKGVLFFDYGNSSSDTYAKMFGSLMMSYGAGIRWASPLGPLLLMYGIPVNPRSGLDSPSGRFEFSIGSLF